MQDQNPLNPLPVALIVIVAAMIAVEAALSLAGAGMVGGARGIGWRTTAVQDWGFAPAVTDFVFGRGMLTLDLLKRFVTYAFVHGSFTHAAFAVVILLAMGKFVGEVVGNLGLFVLFVASTILGALVYGLLAPGNLPLYGAYPAAYGMIGAFSYVLFVRLGQLGQNRLLAFRLIGVLLAIQLVFAALFGGNPTWIADLAGFAAGFAIAPVLVPGGWRALRARLNRR